MVARFPRIRSSSSRWRSRRCFRRGTTIAPVKYRKINRVLGLRGTAVNVQAMVFGNTGDESASGVCFTRNPSTGEKTLR